MKLPRFGVEGWLNSYEREAVYDIAGVSIEALTLQELFELTGESETAFYQELLAKKLIMVGLKGHQNSRLRWLAYTRTCRLIISSKPMGLQERRC